LQAKKRDRLSVNPDKIQFEALMRTRLAFSRLLKRCMKYLALLKKMIKL
jgi:hypothetical protein